MSEGYYFVAAGFALLTLGVWLFDRVRTRRRGPDTITAFMTICLLQTGVAGAGIFASLPLVDPAEPTGAPAFDHIFLTADPSAGWMILGLLGWFVASFYLGCALFRIVLQHRRPPVEGPQFALTVRPARVLLFLAAGAAITLLSFQLMGSTPLERYINLVLLRAGDASVPRTALNSNAFALTQAWGWLSVLALLAVWQRKGIGLWWVVALALVVGFALLGVSRRALFLPVLIGYLAFVLHHGKWNIKWVIGTSLPLLVLLAYGKEIIAAIAFGVPFESVQSQYSTIAAGTLRALSDLGITTVESLGSMTLVESAPRLGVDHVLSIMQRFPEGMLGWDFNFPERFVRVSTAAFLDANAQDIPPGLMGQMWHDFRIAGPLVWGMVFALPMSVVQFFHETTRRSLESSAVFVLIVFIVALPLNTGSFDFTFNVDILALLVALWWCTRYRRILPPVPNPAPLVTPESQPHAA
jgi:hypothetical protein